MFQTIANDDLHSGQGANTFGMSIDLDRLPIRFHRRPPKIKKPTKKPNLSDGVRLFIILIEKRTKTMQIVRINLMHSKLLVFRIK